MDKKLYQGTFNNRGEVLVEWVRAANESIAYKLLTARLGAQMGKTTTSVRLQFNGSKNNFEIKEVKE